MARTVSSAALISTYDQCSDTRPSSHLEHRLVHELARLEVARAGDDRRVDEEADEDDPEQSADDGADSHV